MAWIHWDPNPVLFILPLVHKPVVWYGVLFALGFYLAYLLMLFLAERFKYQDHRFKEEDVVDWDLFREDICYKREGYMILSELGPVTKNALLEGKIWSNEMKSEVLEVLNNTFREGEMQFKGVTEREKQLASIYALKSDLILHRLSVEHQYKGVFFSFKERAKKLTDGLFSYVFFGTLIGARVGHLLFYRNPKEYLSDPYQIIAIWEGGLASHGAVIGIVVSLMLFVYKTKGYSLLQLIDLITAPVALCAVFIRFGNFFNQEILGIPSEVPWAIIFGHALDGSAAIPRHPVQIYEAICYFFVLCILIMGWRYRWSARVGLFSGIFFVGVFGSRFFLEFFKDSLGVYDGVFPLMTGQLLSIPITLLGFFLLIRKRKQRKRLL